MVYVFQWAMPIVDVLSPFRAFIMFFSPERAKHLRAGPHCDKDNKFL
jgi:hypothetical protein